jgi:hypothetical protein
MLRGSGFDSPSAGARWLESVGAPSRPPDSLQSPLLRRGLPTLRAWCVDAVDNRLIQGYTFGMKTAISLPDKVFREAERFARRVRKTRSRLYAEALAEYLARHAPDDITESMNQVCDRIGVVPDAFNTKAARGLLARESW